MAAAKKKKKAAKKKKDWRDAYWERHYEALMRYAETLDADDWLALYGGDEDQVDAVMEDSLKHQGIEVLHLYNRRELDRIVRTGSPAAED